MRRRAFAMVVVALALAALPATAAAQSNPFGPLPPPAAPTPTPTPLESPADQSSVSRPLLLGIAGAVALLFVGIGFYISRDARRHLTEDDRRALEKPAPRPEDERRRGEATRKKTRAKTRAQKQARKRQRSR